MSTKLCSHQRCLRSAQMGMGWGLSTGLLQWYCADHFVPALTRLSRLLVIAGRDSRRSTLVSAPGVDHGETATSCGSREVAAV